MGLIDFQWTGRGLCATDVAYCIVASACPSVMDAHGAEEDFLRYYHGELVRFLGDRGMNSSNKPNLPSWDIFFAQYKLAFCDFGRNSIASMWNKSGIVQLLRERESEGSLLFNATNKNLSLMCWVLRRLLVYSLDVPRILREL